MFIGEPAPVGFGEVVARELDAVPVRIADES
jgi:hypothetical protein